MLEMMLEKDCLCKLVLLMEEGHVPTLGGPSPMFYLFFVALGMVEVDWMPLGRGRYQSRC